MCNRWDPCAVPPIKIVDCQLAQVVDSGGVGETADVGFRVTNPTAKLHLTLLVFVAPGLQGDGSGPTVHDYTGETWQLYDVVAGRADAGGAVLQDIDCNPLFYNPFPTTPEARQLPDTYEGETGIKVIRGLVHTDPVNNQVGERYMVRAVWEPVDCCMTTEERQYWFGLCQLTADANTPVEVNQTPL